LWTHSAAPRESTTILTTVMMCIVAGGSTDHAKPHFHLFFTTISMSKKMFFSEHELKKALRDTST